MDSILDNSIESMKSFPRMEIVPDMIGGRYHRKCILKKFRVKHDTSKCHRIGESR